jgi:hypothetical protein
MTGWTVVLFRGDAFHPIDNLAVELFLRPYAFARRKPHHVTVPNP